MALLTGSKKISYRASVELVEEESAEMISTSWYAPSFTKETSGANENITIKIYWTGIWIPSHPNIAPIFETK